MPTRLQPAPGEDLFPTTRNDDQLRQLVFRLATETKEPFRALVSNLVGEDLTEADARRRWAAFVTHRRALAAVLRRPVHLRVAALDLLTSRGEAPKGSLVVSRNVLDRLWEAATLDGLTGLTNARHFRELLRWQLAQRNRVPLTLAFLDLDGFKGLNDRAGHAAGDAALKVAAKGLKALARRGDLVARLGGDEFVVLFVGATLKDAQSLTDRARVSLEASLGADGVGLSFGFAEATETDTAETLLKRADESMYRVKKTRSSRRAKSAAPRPVALFATTRADVYAGLQAIFAERGVLLLPAPTAQALETLRVLLAPQLVLVHALFPPRGGGALLESLGAQVKCALVVPRAGWRAGAPDGATLVTVDRQDGVLKRLLSGIAPASLGPLPPLDSTARAAEFLSIVGTLARGGRVAEARLAALAGVEAFDHLRRALGS